MRPAEREVVFSKRALAATITGIDSDDGADDMIVGLSLGEAILFVAEEAGIGASNAHVSYGESRTLSYTDCLSVYRDFGLSLKADAKS
ncbi:MULTISPECIES: hypothetical protein [unclassified Rhizobium]|uniref:hypothetical protein n=1 Tax=unclassified Rhizobium TaxID=2613769 RepID=UPI001AD9C9B1|nr:MULTISPECIES: hypothetical protein [unclassified Rhizobium]MBO9098793.1 hypothetical protein [Rhizobium sp. L58/93]MBO9132402.1 hypothetical protein [Rhizobium sp. B209b/85]MBO9169059.1 hypothetical protein [Rhizobium sp. L245/93]MBO9185009.1 hypothetical protein [Rhizobium sp. E27B/91]QXZ85164.1 hypothetical protein J5287_06470 [Rhizobium sp. K1/93]